MAAPGRGAHDELPVDQLVAPLVVGVGSASQSSQVHDVARAGRLRWA